MKVCILKKNYLQRSFNGQTMDTIKTLHESKQDKFYMRCSINGQAIDNYEKP